MIGWVIGKLNSCCLREELLHPSWINRLLRLNRHTLRMRSVKRDAARVKTILNEKAAAAAAEA